MWPCACTPRVTPLSAASPSPARSARARPSWAVLCRLCGALAPALGPESPTGHLCSFSPSSHCSRLLAALGRGPEDRPAPPAGRSPRREGRSWRGTARGRGPWTAAGQPPGLCPPHSHPFRIIQVSQNQQFCKPSTLLISRESKYSNPELSLFFFSFLREVHLICPHFYLRPCGPPPWASAQRDGKHGVSVLVRVAGVGGGLSPRTPKLPVTRRARTQGGPVLRFLRAAGALGTVGTCIACPPRQAREATLCLVCLQTSVLMLTNS